MAHRCPDFVIELLSPSDSVPTLGKKMQSWIANGAALAWLIDPYRREVIVYRPGATPATVSEPLLHGSGPVEGFTLDLNKVWRFYES